MAALLGEESDTCVWTGSTNGNFSLSSAWKICRAKQNALFLNSLMWSPVIPLHWSIVVWRAIHGKLPLDTSIQKKGIQLASKCCCCVKSSIESTKHVFLSSRGAQRIWQWFEGKLGIQCSNEDSLTLKLNDWWRIRFRSPCFKMLLIVTPICIIWELWRNRCFGKFDGRRGEISAIIKNIEIHLSILLIKIPAMTKQCYQDEVTL